MDTSQARGRAARVVIGLATVATLAFAQPAVADRGRCDDCGTVVTTNRRDQKGSGTAGTIVGGVGGAVAGNVLGHNTTSTVLGGVGGAVAGNIVGNHLTRRKVWSVQIRMDRRAERRDIDFDQDPEFHQGERVRVVGNSIERLER